LYRSCVRTLRNIFFGNNADPFINSYGISVIRISENWDGGMECEAVCVEGIYGWFTATCCSCCWQAPLVKHKAILVNGHKHVRLNLYTASLIFGTNLIQSLNLLYLIFRNTTMFTVLYFVVGNRSYRKHAELQNPVRSY
jgi:hypothetical protein